jgi:uncharacterized protein (DUF58 family)
MAATQSILSPDFVKKIERLSLVAKRAFSGQSKGDRRSIKRGSSIEFADYREYAVGDDLRYVDWRAYARLDKMFLKLFIEEEDLTIHLLIDTSKSMDFGEPLTKLDYARRLAAALGYIALSEHDRVYVAPFHAGIGEVLPPQRGKQGIIPFFRYLEDKTPVGGETRFGDALSRYAAQIRGRGIVVVLSDFFDDSHERGLKALMARRMQIVLMHVLDKEEVNPSIKGDLKLVDSENGDFREVSVSPYLIGQYKNQLKAFRDSLHATASRYDMDYIPIDTATSFEEIVIQSLRRINLVK